MAIEIVCIWCGKSAMKRGRGKGTAKACSKYCSAKWCLSRPDVREKLRRAQDYKRLKNKPCEWCKMMFKPNHSKRRFCGMSCVGHWSNTLPHIKLIRIEQAKAMGALNRGRRRPDSRARMLKNNPIWIPGIAERVALANRGRTFLARGGNGKLTKPQKKLLRTLGWKVDKAEIAIPTISVRDRFQSLPPSYKVDLGDLGSKVAIEVDGMTHKTKLWKFLDRRKTSVLNALGWVVVRYWNEDVLANARKIAEQIKVLIAARHSEGIY